jgi:hypothetical protein
VITTTEKTEGTLFNRRDYEIELKKPIGELRTFERSFISSILGSTDVGAKVDLGQAKGRFGTQVAKIEREMYEELVNRGYFGVSPEKTRSTYRAIARTALLFGVIAFVLFGLKLVGISGWVLIPVGVLMLVFGSLYAVAKYMPKKTYSGAETAAKWRAFKRYLENLDQNRATEGATDLFNSFLPYAVAFGIERSWVQKFADAGAPPPDWYGGGGTWVDPGRGRLPRGRRSSWGGWTTGGGTAWSGGDGGRGGGFDMPTFGDVQDASDSAGKSLQGMSSGLFDLFDLAGSAFESFGSSSSRSGGGGSRHSGFSGGGRSRGGGGGRSGGGGGGRRGFG